MAPPLLRVFRELLLPVIGTQAKTPTELAAETAENLEPGQEPNPVAATGGVTEQTSSPDAIADEILNALAPSFPRHYVPLTKVLRPIFKGRASFVAAIIVVFGTLVGAVAPWQRVLGSAPNTTPTAASPVSIEPSPATEAGLPAVVTATATSIATPTSTASLPPTSTPTPTVSTTQSSPVSGPRADIVGIEKQVEGVSYTAARVRAVIRFSSNECLVVYLMIKRWHDDVQRTGELYDWQSPQEVCPGKSSTVIVDLALHLGTGRMNDCGMPYEIYLTAIPREIDQDWQRRYVSQSKPIPAQAAPLGAKRLTQRGETIIPGKDICAHQPRMATPTAAPSPDTTSIPATTEPSLNK